MTAAKATVHQLTMHPDHVERHVALFEACLPRIESLLDDVATVGLPPEHMQRVLVAIGRLLESCIAQVRNDKRRSRWLGWIEAGTARDKVRKGLLSVRAGVDLLLRVHGHNAANDTQKAATP